MGILNFCKKCGARRVRDVKSQLEKLFSNKQVAAHLCGLCLSPLLTAVRIKPKKECLRNTLPDLQDAVDSTARSTTKSAGKNEDVKNIDGIKEEQSSPGKRLTRLSTGTIEPQHHGETDLADDLYDNESIDVPFDSVMSQDSSSDEGDIDTTSKLKLSKKTTFKKSTASSVLKGQKIVENINKKKKKKARNLYPIMDVELTEEQIEMRRSLDPKLLAMYDTEDKPLTKALKCKECKVSFRTLTCFMKHISTHTGEELSIAKPYICKHCEARFSNMTAFERHLGRHYKRKPFVCNWDRCFAKFACKRYLTKHIRRHEGHKSYTYSRPNMKERRFPCTAEGCEYIATTKDGLNIHKNTHTNARPYKCSYCDRRFNDPSSKRSHEGNKHSNSKDNHFMCESCGYSSYFKSDLMKHQRIHSGDKPFACNQCDYRCNRRDNLKKHLRIHSGDKTYKCFRCDMVFPSLRACKNHEKTHSQTPSQLQPKSQLVIGGVDSQPGKPFPHDEGNFMISPRPAQPQPPQLQPKPHQVVDGGVDSQTGKPFARDERHFLHSEAKKILAIHDVRSMAENHPVRTSETVETKPHPVPYGHSGLPVLGGESSQQQQQQQCQPAQGTSQSEDWIRAVSFLQHLQQM